MTSPLDGRIERIAQEAIQRTLSGMSAGPHELVSSIADELRPLHDDFHALAARVTELAERLELLESAPARRTRKSPAGDA